jgi:hypothetical protein
MSRPEICVFAVDSAGLLLLFFQIEKDLFCRALKKLSSCSLACSQQTRPQATAFAQRSPPIKICFTGNFSNRGSQPLRVGGLTG